MRQVFLLLIVVFISGCGAGKNVTNVDDVFEAVKTKANKSKCGIYPELFFANRKSLYSEMGFLNINQDIVYVLQEYDIESGELRESIWNKTSKIEYSSFKGDIKKSSTSLFDSEIYEATNSWSKDVLNGKSKDFGTNDITTYRITIDQNQVKIDCMVF